MSNISAKQLATVIILFVFALSGCATTAEKKAKVTVPEGSQARIVKFKDAIGEGIVFEPKFYSKLDILRENAALKNNRLTAEIAAGTAAAVAAYTSSDAVFKAMHLKPNPFATMAATAGSAYAAAAIAGAIYDMFTPKAKRY